MKSLFILLALTMSVSAFARDTREGRYTKNDGTTIIRVEVGNDRESDSRALARRVIQLERAVRELQNRVYDLEDDSRPMTREVTYFTCSTKSSFNESFLGATALTEIEARENALDACKRKRHAMHCGEEIRCESRKEIQKI